MRSRTGRIVLLLVLLIVGASAAVFTFQIDRQVADLGRAEQSIADRVDHILATIHKIGDAQLAYITPDNTDGLTPEQVPSLIAQVLDELTQIEHDVRAPRSVTELKVLGDHGHQLAEFESRAQEHVRLGQELMAADVISVEARAAVTVMTTALADLRSSEVFAIETERAALLRQVWMAVGGAAGLWVLGVVALVRIPRAQPVAPPVAAASSAILPIDSAIDRMREAPPPSADLALAADLCTAIARIGDAGELPALLTQAAQILGASGVVVWMAAGDELIAAAAHGYDPKALARVGRINRVAQNATAAAWRLGAMQIVQSDEQSRGAVVVPMLGRDRCIGVLAVEVPHGREADGATHAVTRFLAAQLAATLTPWPAPSVADHDIPPLDKAAEA